MVSNAHEKKPDQPRGLKTTSVELRTEAKLLSEFPPKNPPPPPMIKIIMIIK